MPTMTAAASGPRSGSSKAASSAGSSGSHEVCKIEGVHARPDGDTIRLLLVTDADDADIPAQLLTATLD